MAEPSCKFDKKSLISSVVDEVFLGEHFDAKAAATRRWLAEGTAFHEEVERSFGVASIK